MRDENKTEDKKMKKITRATIKKFVRENDKLYVNVKREFDGMIDGCRDHHNGFVPAKQTTEHAEHTLGVTGVWLVGQSRDYFRKYEDGAFDGYEVSNCCGCFIIATKAA